MSAFPEDFAGELVDAIETDEGSEPSEQTDAETFPTSGGQRVQDFTATTVAHKREAMQNVGVAARDTEFQPGTSDMSAIADPADPPTIRPATMELTRTLEYQG